MTTARLEHENKVLRDRLAQLTEAAGDAVILLARAGTIVSASRFSLELFGVASSPVGRSMLELIGVGERRSFEAAKKKAFTTGEAVIWNQGVVRLDETIWIEWRMSAYKVIDGTEELIAVGRNISAHKEQESQLRHLATHDALTGLPNRILCSDRIRMAIARSKRTGRGFALAVLDLDQFKKINDALGHSVGDSVLEIAARRLLNALRDSDTLARIGGDEFVILLADAAHEAEVMRVGRRLLAELRMPFDVDGHVLHIGATMGAAIYPAHGEDEIKLLAHADSAMYRAKETGKGRCVIYAASEASESNYDVTLEAAMFDAVRNDEFRIHYQPIVDARTLRIKGFEALMRWPHPTLGAIAPSQFIPMAENNGLINPLGAWILKSACMQLKHFEAIAQRPLQISVNVSPRQFRSENFLEMVDEAIRLSGMPGTRLLLEITEGILMNEPDHAETQLDQLSSRGIHIAVDDFGTGYSSLAYLKRFPISALKIDRSFVRDLPASAKDTAICNAILSLSEHMNLSTIAEGVENAEQMDFFAASGCHFLQGYHTGRPMTPESALALLCAERMGQARKTEPARVYA